MAERRLDTSLETSSHGRGARFEQRALAVVLCQLRLWHGLAEVAQKEVPAPISSGPDHYVIEAAFAHIDHWVKSGRSPASAPRFQYKSLNPATFAFDSNGNVLGGIRAPFVDMPVARLSGLSAGVLVSASCLGQRLRSASLS